MKTLIIILAALSITGCDGITRLSQHGITEKCIDGVTYIYDAASIGNRGYGYMSVKFNRDSKVVLCGGY